MFTWIPIHEETAKRLLKFKNRSRELAALILRMHEKGLKALPANEKDKNGNTVPLRDVDPFSFLAGFNRPVTSKNRKALWQFLKDEWSLHQPVPEDFDGLPVANLQNSWLFPYECDRSPDHMPLLWRFFEHIIAVEPSGLDTNLMDQCLAKPHVGLASLTMGMFWACPEKWISTDKKNLEFARTEGIEGVPTSAANYVIWLARVREAVGGDGVKFSRQAHLCFVAKRKGEPPGLFEHGPKRGSADEGVAPPSVSTRGAYNKAEALQDLFMPEVDVDRAIALLRRKKNIILQGAPGTGKTFVARRLAYLLMGEADPSRVPMVQFHQSTAYEDFIQGYRPDGNGGFELKNGIFHEFCRKAAGDSDGRPFVFIIDEINRGNLSKILGEVMMLIEADKRGPSFAVPLAYASSQDDTFHVPENVFVIGTMNSADRSLSLVDYALRRRFGFLDMEPAFDSPAFAQYLAARGAHPDLIPAVRGRMNEVNRMIAADSHNLGKGFRIGHSFFVPDGKSAPDEEWYRDIVRHEILPLIDEYWLDDEKSRSAAEAILLAEI